MLNRNRQNQKYANKFIYSRPPKTIFTGTLFSAPGEMEPDPKTFPLPPREWFQISEQS
jgi:hypothetical protein